MMRNKNKYVAISNESIRKATFEKRREALCKKVKELCILCDVEAGVIVQDLEQNEEFLWPSRDYVKDKVMKFLSIPETKRYRKLCTHDNYLLAKVTKKIENMRKTEKRNDEKEMSRLMHDLIKGKITIQELDMKQTNGLAQLVLDKMNMLDKRIEKLELKHTEIQAPPLMASPPPRSPFPMVAPAKAIEVQPTALNASIADPKFIEDLDNDQWVIESMYAKEIIAYPSFSSNYGLYHTNIGGSTEGNIMWHFQTIAGTSSGNEMGLVPQNKVDLPAIGENEKFLYDINPYYGAHIFFP